MGTDSAPRAPLYTESVDLSRWSLEAIAWSHQRDSPAVILIPGHFCPRNFWFPPTRDGFGDWLATQNFAPIALTDAQSTTPLTPKRRTSDWVFHILPRVIAHVHETRGKPPYLIGYSAGGTYALACLHLLKEQLSVAGLVMVGSQVQCHQEGFTTRGALRLLGRVAATINGRWLGLPESFNSAVELSEYVDVKAGAGMLHNPIAPLRLKQAIEVNTNILTLYSAADRVAPPHGVRTLHDKIEAPNKKLIELESNGTLGAIQHFELLGRKHQNRVWPHLLEWLQRAAD